MITLSAHINVDYTKVPVLITESNNIFPNPSGGIVEGLDRVLNTINIDNPAVGNSISNEESQFGSYYEEGAEQTTTFHYSPSSENNNLQVQYKPNASTVYVGVNECYYYRLHFIAPLPILNSDYVDVIYAYIEQPYSDYIFYDQVIRKYDKTNNTYILGIDYYIPTILLSQQESIGSPIGSPVEVFPTVNMKLRCVKEGGTKGAYYFYVKSQQPTDNISFTFDKINGRYATEIKVDGRIYSNSSPEYKVQNLPNQKEHEVEITKWSEQNQPLVIMGINSSIPNIQNIDYTSLSALDFSITDRGNIEQPSFGIFSNSGSMEIMDNHEYWARCVEAGVLKEGIECTIYLNNTLENIQTPIAVAEASEWGYDNDNRVVSVTLKDDLEEWQEINIPAFEYDPRKSEAKPYSWLYAELWGITASRGYDMQSLDDLDPQTKEILINSYFQYPLLYAGTLWEAWTKLCNVAGLHIYKNSVGKIVCKYNGGN